MGVVPVKKKANVLDSDTVVNEFKPQLLYYVHFWTNILGKDMDPLIPPVMREIVPLLFFYKDGLCHWIVHDGWYVIKQRN